MFNSNKKFKSQKIGFRVVGFWVFWGVNDALYFLIVAMKCKQVFDLYFV